MSEQTHKVKIQVTNKKRSKPNPSSALGAPNKKRRLAIRDGWSLGGGNPPQLQYPQDKTQAERNGQPVTALGAPFGVSSGHRLEKGDNPGRTGHPLRESGALNKRDRTNERSHNTTVPGWSSAEMRGRSKERDRAKEKGEGKYRERKRNRTVNKTREREDKRKMKRAKNAGK